MAKKRTDETITEHAKRTHKRLVLIEADLDRVWKKHSKYFYTNLEMVGALTAMIAKMWITKGEE